MRSYASLLKSRSTNRKVWVNTSQPIIGSEVIRDSSGRWTWVKWEQQKYKRKYHFRTFLRNGVNTSQPIIGSEVIRDSSGRWTWVKWEQQKYKRKYHFRTFLRNDSIATRACIRCLVNSSWRDWVVGSRPFF